MPMVFGMLAFNNLLAVSLLIGLLVNSLWSLFVRKAAKPINQ